MQSPAIILMSAAEAAECVKSIKGSIGDARSMLWELNDRQGWKALGYASFKACVERELGISKQHAYRLLTAEKTDLALSESPMGDSIPERQLRELAPVAKDDPEAAREIMQEVRNAKGKNATAKDIREAVERHTGHAARSTESKEVADQVQKLKEAWGAASERARAQFLAWTRGL